MQRKHRILGGLVVGSAMGLVVTAALWRSPEATLAVPSTSVETTEDVLFAFPTDDGAKLTPLQAVQGGPHGGVKLDTALCSDRTVVSVVPQGDNSSFDIIGRKLASDATCLVATRAFAEGKLFLPLQATRVRPAIPCDQSATSNLATIEKRAIHKCQQVGTLGPGGRLLVAEFEPQGKNLLVVITARVGGRLILDDKSAVYDEPSHTGWVEGDNGHLGSGDPNVIFADLFVPVMALQEKSSGNIYLAISQAGGEGSSYVLLRSSGGRFKEVAMGYQGIH